MSRECKIEIPLFTAFNVIIGGEKLTFVGVPRGGCDLCEMKKYGLCGRLYCGGYERSDQEGVQFVRIVEPRRRIVLHMEGGEDPAEEEVEGGEG